VHAGLVIIVPNVTSTLQRELFRAALSFIGERGELAAPLATRRKKKSHSNVQMAQAYPHKS
jgi:hypothetical protein